MLVNGRHLVERLIQELGVILLAVGVSQGGVDALTGLVVSSHQQTWLIVLSNWQSLILMDYFIVAG